jgi:hypothetical protein
MFGGCTKGINNRLISNDIFGIFVSLNRLLNYTVPRLPLSGTGA